MIQKIPVIVGATATGKTETGVWLAKAMNGEIISADSMQIYQKMDIGTAKPTAEEMQGIPHHLINCIKPDEAYSVARYKTEAFQTIEAILNRQKVPIIVGGTGLYINSLTLPWGFSRKDKNDAIRERLEKESAEGKGEQLYQQLESIDPEAARKIHPNNQRRVIRALEIYYATGKTKTALDAEEQKTELPYAYSMMGIDMDREYLYERINQRIDLMIEAGLIEEVKRLLEQGYNEKLIAMKAIGYKEFMPYLKKERSLEETIRILKRDTRHFAKRQLTWFRKDQRIKWYHVDKMTDKKALAFSMLEKCNNV